MVQHCPVTSAAGAAYLTSLPHETIPIKNLRVFSTSPVNDARILHVCFQFTLTEALIDFEW